MKTRRPAAFTLLELLIAAAISTFVGLIAYGVASEGLISFARNVSINRSYSNARQTVARIAQTMQSAGHTPLLVDATGANTTTSPAAGIRFWRYTSSPLYYITTPTLTSNSLTLSLIKPGTTATVIPAPSIGDMIIISAIGFQAQATAVTVTGNNALVSFSGTVVSNTSPTLTSTTLAAATASALVSGGGQMSCLDWTSVAFIAINGELRYFPKYLSGTTSVSTPSNYKVLAYLAAQQGTSNPAQPFSLGPPPSINVDLYAQSPDYSNRNPPMSGGTGTLNLYNGVGTANTYTYLQTAVSPRNASLFHGTF